MVTSLSLVLLLILGLSESDWPNWGGPRADGVSDETGLLDAWPTGGPRIAWQRSLGQGYSSIAVVSGRAYTQCQDLWGQYLICLDAETGGTVWSHRYDAPYETAGIYPGPRSTPAVSAGRVYGVSPDGVLFCLESRTGKPLWQVNTAERFRGEGTEFGYAASPRVIDGRVILPIGGRNAAVIAFDAMTGTVVWSTGDEPASYCTVQSMTVSGVPCLLAYLQNSILLCRTTDGAVLWREDLSHGYDEHSAMPLVQGDQFVISGPFRAGAMAYRLSLSDPSASKAVAAVAWTSDKLSNDTASSVLVNGAIYGFDLRDAQAKAHRPSRGEFRCLDWMTGAVRWSDSSLGHATVLAADGKLILFNDRGEVIVGRADAQSFREIGRAAVFEDEICWTAPALSDGRLYLRSMTRAVCLDLRATSTPAKIADPSATRGHLAPLLAQRRHWHWDWLLNGEREHPFMRPMMDELTRWYLWSLAAIAPPLLIGIALNWRRQSSLVTVCVLAATFAGSAVATPLLNRHYEQFVFTWPAALLVAFLGVVMVGQQFQGRPLTWREHVAGRLALFLFVTICVGYFLLLRRFSLPHEWVFLMGFLPAWWPTSRLSTALRRRGVTPLTALGIMATFTGYFWCCAAWHLWPRALGG